MAHLPIQFAAGCLCVAVIHTCTRYVMKLRLHVLVEEIIARTIDGQSTGDDSSIARGQYSFTYQVPVYPRTGYERPAASGNANRDQ